jgi:hypothetical protein
VPQTKITKYLLSMAHEDGRSQANFFFHFGFSPENWQELAVALQQHAQQHPVGGSIAVW